MTNEPFVFPLNGTPPDEFAETAAFSAELNRALGQATTALQSRPGKFPAQYTSIVNGRGGGAGITGQIVADATFGDVWEVTGAGIVALRDRVAVEEGAVLFARYRRTQDPTDPAGDAIRFRVDWLDANYAKIGDTVDVRTDTTTGSSTGSAGVIEAVASFNTPDATLTPPSGAVYAVPYVQTYGTDGKTEVINLGSYSRFALVADFANTAEIANEALSIQAPNIAYPSGFQYPPETIPDFPETNIIHVATNGSDALEGEARRGAVQSLERAIEVAGDNPNDKFALSVHPGAYVTQGNLDVPDNVTAAFGNHNARSTRLIPDTGAEERSCFRLGNGGYVEGFSFEGGWRTDDLEDPTVGVISFRPGAVIARTVYVHNVTFWRPSPPVLIPPPLDRENGNPLVGRGPLCVLADKSVVSQYSPFPQIMLWGATPTAQNNIGYCAKNGGFINGINAVGLWSHRGYLALNGGEMILTNCASQFGDWTLDADGFREQVVAFQTSPANLSVQTSAADAIIANRESLIDAMWSNLSSSGFLGSEELTRRDAGFFLDAIEGDLRSGQQEGATIFAEGMFDWKGDFVGNPNNKPWYIEAWENLRDGINGLGISAAAQAMVTALVDEVIIATVNNSSPNKRIVPSQITSLFHQWNNAGSGVNGRALRRPPLPVRDTIRERNLGRVIWNGQDDQRRLYLNEQFVINGDTGQAEGGAVDRTILPRARLAALIAQGQN